MKGILWILIFLFSFNSWCFSSPKVYVGNFADNTLSVIDTNMNKVIKTISIPPGPANMATSPDNKYVYVSNSGTYTVSVIDTALDRAVTHFEVGRIPQGIAVDPSGQFILVCVIGSHSILYVTSKNKQYTADAKILVGKVKDILLQNNNLAFASLIDNKQYGIAKVNPMKNTIIDVVSLVNAPKSMVFGPNQRIYFTAEDVNAIQVYSTLENKVIKQIPIASALGGITMSHDGKFGLVTSQNEGKLYRFDPKKEMIEDSFAVGTQPYAVLLSADDKKAYVSNEASNNISVIDLVNKKIIATIPVGHSPRYIAIAK